jgi:hypothetical protein
MLQTPFKVHQTWIFLISQVRPPIKIVLKAGEIIQSAKVSGYRLDWYEEKTE